jgi:hypothetical protein
VVSQISGRPFKDELKVLDDAQRCGKNSTITKLKDKAGSLELPNSDTFLMHRIVCRIYFCSHKATAEGKNAVIKI